MLLAGTTVLSGKYHVTTGVYACATCVVVTVFVIAFVSVVLALNVKLTPSTSPTSLKPNPV